MLANKRSQMRDEIIQAIKAAAWQQMTEQGTAGLNLRQIARDLGVTAPAIYTYFPSRDDLITALIVDAFTQMGDAMEQAANQAADHPLMRMLAGVYAYRQWAVENPVGFQLIYGNPIPGYSAPAEITTPLSRRQMGVLAYWFGEAIKAGDVELAQIEASLDGVILAQIRSYGEESGMPGPPAMIYWLTRGWAHIHGMVMLEIFHHSPNLVGDAERFYKQEMVWMFASIGIDLPALDANTQTD